MKTLTLKNRFQTNATLLPNDFIDNYMIDANGEFVKVYLFLLRHLDDPCSSITISTIADCLNNTENDILRAFRYWENAGLLCVERDADGRITGLEMQKTARPGRTSVAEPAADTPQETAAPARKAPAAPRAKSKAVPIDSFRAQKEIKSLLFIAEQYLGKTLTHTEMETITNRGPAASELAYIKKWAEEYGFAPDIIEEACRRTIAATHQPSFEYADKILTKWHGRNIRHLKDVSSLDEEYQKERSSGKTAIRSRTVTKNLNNFERRNYDMDSLEEQLLNSN